MSELIIGPKDVTLLLPHRHPFLLLDGVKDYVPGESIVGVKAVAISEPHFAGHFPGFPIMPGVLVIEALAQACAMYGTLGGMDWKPGEPIVPPAEGPSTLGVLGSVKVQLKRPVMPGILLDLNVKKVRDAGPSTFFDVKAESGGTTYAKGNIIVSHVDPAQLG